MNFKELAICNIAKYGDTDIFPYPIENFLFFDKKADVEKILDEIDSNFDEAFNNYTFDVMKSCIPVGYTGYRWATVISPIWNAYLLMLTLRIAEDIEAKRIPTSRNTVFSYRLKIDSVSYKFFDTNINWRLFYSTAIDTAQEYTYVIRFDISDFYNRIYHHKLENTLRRCTSDTDAVNKILKILQKISDGTSYGLPVGGDASRILAEALLNSFDEMMISRRIRYCRFVDDYIVFAKSKEEAYKLLNFCAEYLLRNEGLGLQKSKTQILTKDEFVTHAKSTLNGGDDTDVDHPDRSPFLRLNLHYDPYSDTASEDYSALKEEIQRFDILSLIKSEVRKSKIHQGFGRHIMRAISFLEDPKLSLAFNVLSSNLDVLYPIYPSLMMLAQKKLLMCSPNTVDIFINKLCDLVDLESYILQTENNASYTARVLSLVNTERSTQAISELYTRTTSESLTKTNCIYAMTNMNNTFWLADIKNKYGALQPSEKRAFIASSYFLGDEGKHWRDLTKKHFSKFELLLRDWVADKSPSQNTWKLPL